MMLHIGFFDPLNRCSCHKSAIFMKSVLGLIGMRQFVDEFAHFSTLHGRVAARLLRPPGGIAEMSGSGSDNENKVSLTDLIDYLQRQRLDKFLQRRAVVKEKTDAKPPAPKSRLLFGN